uniref:Chromatin accessibility complex protein 1 n=2 Tax=Anatidae TaxID=8830 RepID=A0A8B9IHT9_ANSCY
MAARLSGGGGENRLVSLPLSRIRVIMKSSPEVSSINQDALFLTAKATELFVQYLASYSYKHGRGKEKNALTYSDLSHTAEECETFQFLAGIYGVTVNPVCNWENEVLSSQNNSVRAQASCLVVYLLYNTKMELISYVTENPSLAIEIFVVLPIHTRLISAQHIAISLPQLHLKALSL